ncbi:MAG: hypothetical protein CBC25_02300 [Pelagibacteraceae bacterium TMED65]|nr:hypothetical protein [Rickettsiales bacterium]OUU52732.1 MAG: hypothetical protein CBC25_02300 [Pelagibacteraceae bacterium TMED65]
MFDIIADWQNEIGFYFNIFKLIFYFFVGALVLLILNNIRKLLSFFVSKFSREKLLARINFMFKVFIFVLVSILIGWMIIFIVF